MVIKTTTHTHKIEEEKKINELNANTEDKKKLLVKNLVFNRFLKGEQWNGRKLNKYRKMKYRFKY